MGKSQYSFRKESNKSRLPSKIAVQFDLGSGSLSTNTHQGIFVHDKVNGGQHWVWWFQPTFPKSHAILTHHLHDSLPSVSDRRRMTSFTQKVRWGKIFRHKHHMLGIVPPSYALTRDRLGSTNPWYPFKNASHWRQGCWQTFFATSSDKKLQDPIFARAYAKYGKRPIVAR